MVLKIGDGISPVFGITGYNGSIRKNFADPAKTGEKIFRKENKSLYQLFIAEYPDDVSIKLYFPMACLR